MNESEFCTVIARLAKEIQMLEYQLEQANGRNEMLQCQLDLAYGAMNEEPAKAVSEK